MGQRDPVRRCQSRLTARDHIPRLRSAAKDRKGLREVVWVNRGQSKRTLTPTFSVAACLDSRRDAVSGSLPGAARRDSLKHSDRADVLIDFRPVHPRPEPMILLD